MPRLPVLIRQTRVFDLVVQGRTHQQICAQLQISEDTVARDMQAIGEQVQELARGRAGEVLAVALATYQSVIDNAWREYRTAVERERAWYAGKLDYEHESTSTKTIALEGTESDTPIGTDESQPLEVKRTRRWVRPQLLNHDRHRWLTLIVDTTREMTELLGIKKLTIEQKQSGKVDHVHMSLDEWKQQAQKRVAEAEATLSLLGEDAPDEAGNA